MWRYYYHDAFYTLNEEIVIGALILYFLIGKIKITPILSSIGLALFFSLIHFVFYKWLFTDKGIIHITALISLFLIGLARNNLILINGHIGYSWALHFGWIAIMFGSIHLNDNTHEAISELDRFNIYLGSKEILVISILLALISLFVWYKKNNFRSSYIINN